MRPALVLVLRLRRMRAEPEDSVPLLLHLSLSLLLPLLLSLILPRLLFQVVLMRAWLAGGAPVPAPVEAQLVRLTLNQAGCQEAGLPARAPQPWRWPEVAGPMSRQVLMPAPAAHQSDWP